MSGREGDLAFRAPMVLTNANFRFVVTEQLGSDAYLHVALPGRREHIVLRGVGERNFRRGDAIGLTPQPGLCHLFDDAGTTIRNIPLRGAA